MSRIKEKDYSDAILSQGACNLSGIVHSFSDIMDRIWEEARERGEGTDWINNHPICRLFAEQISHLTCEKDYFEAYKECEGGGN